MHFGYAVGMCQVFPEHSLPELTLFAQALPGRPSPFPPVKFQFFLQAVLPCFSLSTIPLPARLSVPSCLPGNSTHLFGVFWLLELVH